MLDSSVPIAQHSYSNNILEVDQPCDLLTCKKQIGQRVPPTFEPISHFSDIAEGV